VLRIVHAGSLGSKYTATKERGEKKICCPTFFLETTKITKLKMIFNFRLGKKKIWANLQIIIIEISTQKIVVKLSNIWVWDTGSGIRKKLIPDPGSRCKNYQ
jgi:hypothetical protein